MNPPPLNAGVIKGLRIVENPSVEQGNCPDAAVGFPLTGQPVCIGFRLSFPAVLLNDQ